MRPLFLLVLLFFSVQVFAQEDWQGVYRATATKVNDLVDTRLNVQFDFEHSFLRGEAWIKLSPHFYATDSLTLDAKGMEIDAVDLVQGDAHSRLLFRYDSAQLHIGLDRTYSARDTFEVYIRYVSRPDLLREKGSPVITDAKGLFFIDPHDTDPNKPTEVWTQGETEHNSVWFPTIDKPDQKCTEQITMTVPSRFVTLSNGKLVDQKENADGTRTDTWRMDHPNAPYLFFMGVGDYTIVKDAYKGMEVSYYVEPQYASVARKIFGHTPQMIAYFESITGVAYPWNKYSQIVGRDYVSGAMENTTATLHGEGAYSDARQLVDGNDWELTIAHELFHQWFGDYVTCESWSNITLNESFADYSETLWAEHEYGKDAGAENNFNDMQAYLKSGNADKSLVRYHYADKEDVFDLVSYQKGGCILNMLRHVVGDSAFFASLHTYLEANKFGSAEADQLRLAFEKVTGQDLHWFWNEWYYGAGHPKLTIGYTYDDRQKMATVTVSQDSTHVFDMPVNIDVYENGTRTRYPVRLNAARQTFSFPYRKRPELINVDGDHMLLCEKDDDKTFENYVCQYTLAGSYVDRREAIQYCLDHQDDNKAVTFLKDALADPYYGLRLLTLQGLDFSNKQVKKTMESGILGVAKNDPKTTVRGEALGMLGAYNDNSYLPLFEAGTRDSSYSVARNALTSMFFLDSAQAVGLAHSWAPVVTDRDTKLICWQILLRARASDLFAIVNPDFEKYGIYERMYALRTYGRVVEQTSDEASVRRGVDNIVDVRDHLPAYYSDNTRQLINNAILGSILSSKQGRAPADLVRYIRSKIVSN